MLRNFVKKGVKKMKTFTKILLVLSLVFACAATGYVACGDDDGGGGNNTTEQW